MNLLNIAKQRKATKSYNINKKISKKDLQYIFEVTNTAPTSMGLEHWRVISLRDNKIKKHLAIHFGKNKDKFLESSDALIFVTKTKEWFKLGNPEIQRKVKRTFKSISDEYGTETSNSQIEEFEKYIVTADHGNNNNDLTEWSKRQAYIASSFTMLAAMEKEINSTPVEGFTKDLNDGLKTLKLISDKEVVSIVILLGYIDGVEHPTHGPKQLRDDVSKKFIIK